MKGLYLLSMVIDRSPGYAEKIYGQVDAFRKSGIEMDVISLGSDPSVTLIKYPNLKTDNATLLCRFRKNCWNNREKLFSSALQYIEMVNPEVIYIRHPFSDPIFILFLYKLKKSIAPNTIVLSEIPTFPYEHDVKYTIRGRLKLEMDRLCRLFLKYFIDRIISVDYDANIFDIKTISIQNGVDVNAYTLFHNAHGLDLPLRLIGVANLMDYHGYDRIIEAMSKKLLNQNNMKVDIEFHIVGPSTIALSKLKMDVERRNLSKYVIFHGQKTGKDLDYIFNKCHIAVGSLAWHRINVTQASNLKSREYMARGIPFIYAAKDQGLPENYPYALKVPLSDAPINFEEVFDFAKKCYENIGFERQMREFARHEWTWSVVMQPVINEINKLLLHRVDKLKQCIH